MSFLYTTISMKLSISAVFKTIVTNSAPILI